MWEYSIELLALIAVLIVALVQLLLEFFWKGRPENLRRRWAYILVGLVIAGAIANGVGAWQTRVDESQERERTERVAMDREQQAQKERQAISEKIQNLVTLARERDPDLTELEALRAITSEIRSLRERTSQLHQELEGLRRYSKVAKYNALGLTGIAGEGLKENSPIARALEGAYTEVKKDSGPEYFPRCDEQGLSRFANVAKEFPDYPFSYWALAKCLKPIGSPHWRAYAERAMAILEHTTRVSERSPHHDQARKQMEELLSGQ